MYGGSGEEVVAALRLVERGGYREPCAEQRSGCEVVRLTILSALPECGVGLGGMCDAAWEDAGCSQTSLASCKVDGQMGSISCLVRSGEQALSCEKAAADLQVA